MTKKNCHLAPALESPGFSSVISCLTVSHPDTGCMKSLPNPFWCREFASGWQLRMRTLRQDPGSLVSAPPSSLHLSRDLMAPRPPSQLLHPQLLTCAPFTPPRLLYPGKSKIMSVFWLPSYSVGTLWISRNTSALPWWRRGRISPRALLDSPWCALTSLTAF